MGGTGHVPLHLNNLQLRRHWLIQQINRLLKRSFFTNAAFSFSVVLTEAYPNRCWTSVVAAPRLSERVANVFRRLCDKLSVMLARLGAVLPALGKMNTWWLRVGKQRDLRKSALKSSRLKDTIKAIDSACSGPNGGSKDSVDQYTILVFRYPIPSSRRFLGYAVITQHTRQH